MGLFDRVFGQTKLEDAADQSGEDQNLAGFVRSKVEEVRATSNRVAHEGTWMTNIAYILGFDGVFYDTATKQFKPLNGSQNTALKRNRIHVNKILPRVQNRLARLCKSPPKYDIKPESTDTEDKEAARLALQVLNAYWDKERLNQKRVPLYMWTQQCGHAYIKVSWDSQKGPMMFDPETNENIPAGDIRCDVISPFEIFPDPLAKTLEEAQWVIQAKVRKLDYFKTHYPEKGYLVKEEGAWLLSTQYENRINSLSGQNGAQTGGTQVMKNAAIELAYYEKPSSLHKNGRLIIVANGVLLEDKELPCKEIPFVKFDDVYIAGKYYSEAIVTHVRPVQDQYNRTISKRAEWTNKLLAGKLISARGSGLAQEALNDTTEVVMYTPVPNAPNGGMPMALTMPMIPQYAYQEASTLEEMMDDIFGINEVSRGQMPSASIPAIGMQLLQEQDETRLGVTTELNEEAWALVGKLILLYAEAFIKAPRMLKIAGRGSSYAVRQFIGSDIKNNNDVFVVRGSTVPGSKALKRQEVLNAYSQNLLGDPADPKVRENVLSMLEFGDVAEIWQDQALDDAQIRRDIDLIEQGGVPEINPLDNQLAHIQQKNRYRKGDKFLTLPPEAQQVLIKDINQRRALITPPAPEGMDPAAQGAPSPETDEAPMMDQAAAEPTLDLETQTSPEFNPETEAALAQFEGEQAL